MKKNWRTFGPKEEVKLSPFMDDMMVYKENSFEYTKKLLELLKKVKKWKWRHSVVSESLWPRGL